MKINMDLILADSKPEKTAATGTTTTTPVGNHQQQHAIDIPALFEGREDFKIVKVERKDNYTMYVLNKCPFDSSHAGAAILKYADGRIGFKCFHTSCRGKKWKDVVRTLGIELPSGKMSGDPEKSEYFSDEASNAYRVKTTKDGPVNVKLANFTARIEEQVELDDGFEKQIFYKIHVTCGGRSLGPIDIPAKAFASMNWLHRYGCALNKEPGSQITDYLRHGIQAMSQGHVKESKCFAHTGWVETNQGWVYLHAAGGVGGIDIEVRHPAELQRYQLPATPEHETEAIKVSLSFLDIGPRKIMTPLYATIYLSTMATIFKIMPNFCMYLYGPTGCFKTTLAVGMLSHFGDFPSGEKLSNFEDTPNAVERRAGILKDALFVLDDYCPSATKISAQAKENLAQRAIRGLSNRTARARLNADSTEKGRFDARCIGLITGEELPEGQSTLARLSVIKVALGDIDTDKLTAYQQQAHLLPHAMTSFLLWLRDKIPAVQAEFPERFRALRTSAATDGQHRKTPEQTAFFFFALEIVSRWLRDKRIYAEDEAKIFLDESWAILGELADRQARLIQQEDPVLRFTDILQSLITSEKAYIQPMDPAEKTIGTSDFGSNLIGYYDKEFLYLMPTSLWHSVGEFCAREQSHFPFSRNTIYRMLADRGLLIPALNGENTGSIRIKKQKIRIIKLDIKIMDITDEDDDEG